MLMPKKLFIDLKSLLRYLGTPNKGPADERRKNCFLPSYGIPANVRIPQMCRAISRRLQGAELYLSRPIFMHGLCANNISRKSARHSGMPAFKAKQTVSYGHPRTSISKHFVERQQSTQLAYLRRFCNDPDSQGARTLYQRFLWHRSRQHSLRSRFYNHRFMSCALSLGAFSKEQRSSQAPYASGLTREHSVLHRYHRRQSARCQCPGHSDLRSRVFLYHGPRIHRFQKTLRTASGDGVLCDPRQIQFPISQIVFATGRQINGAALRSNDCLDAIVGGLSGAASSRKILRRGKRPALDILDQQFCSRGLNHRSTLQVPLESRTVFQMDQTTSANQGFLRHFRERRQNTSLDCRLDLCADRNYQKTSGPGAITLHNFTNIQREC